MLAKQSFCPQEKTLNTPFISNYTLPQNKDKIFTNTKIYHISSCKSQWVNGGANIIILFVNAILANKYLIPIQGILYFNNLEEQ